MHFDSIHAIFPEVYPSVEAVIDIRRVSVVRRIGNELETTNIGDAVKLKEYFIDLLCKSDSALHRARRSLHCCWLTRDTVTFWTVSYIMELVHVPFAALPAGLREDSWTLA